MKNLSLKAILFLLVIICIVQGNLHAKSLPKIAILGTGGTIAGSGASKTGVAYTAGKASVDILVKSVPGIEKLAELSEENVANIPSQDMNDTVWLKLARRVNELLNESSIDGVVITHGTDTMEETAYFLDLVINTDKPIVLTGSMRPPTSLSPDGPFNIYTSVAVAASPGSWGKGVLVVMNGGIFTARDVTKSNTTNIATFKSPNTGPIGLVDYSNIQYYQESTRRHTSKSQFDITKIDKLPEVCVIYEVEGGAAPLIEAAVKYGYKGIVLAGLGDGNMPKKDEKLLIEAVNNGIPVVISSRVGSGCIQVDAEVQDTKYHLITANDFDPQKAYVLLKVALTQTKSYEKLVKIFNQY